MEPAWDELEGLIDEALNLDVRRASAKWESHARDAGFTHQATPEKEPAYFEKEPAHFLVFRAANRRFAVPVDRVRHLGRVEGNALLMSIVHTDSAAYRLRDIKSALGLAGEKGRMYVALESSEGTFAWAVDGIEKSTIRADHPRNPGAPIQLLAVDQLRARHLSVK